MEKGGGGIFFDDFFYNGGGGIVDKYQNTSCQHFEYEMWCFDFN